MVKKSTGMLMVAIIFLLGFVGGHLVPRIAKAEQKIVELKENLRGAEDRARSARGELYELRNQFDELLGKNPKLAFDLLDSNIEQVAGGNDPNGSFTDYVEPTLREALENGATTAEVHKRLDRILTLAMGGKYYSSFLSQVDASGPGELERYFANLKAELSAR